MSKETTMISKCRSCGNAYWKGTACNCKIALSVPFRSTQARIHSGQPTSVKAHGFHALVDASRVTDTLRVTARFAA